MSMQPVALSDERQVHERALWLDICTAPSSVTGLAGREAIWARIGATVSNERIAGTGLLVAAATGVVASRWVSARSGRRDRVMLTAGVVVLAMRDGGMVLSGIPGRLKVLPRTLLYVELACAASASLLNAATLATSPARARHDGKPPKGALTRLTAAADCASALTFVLHTLRQAIYLTPGRGRLKPCPEATPGAAAST